MAGDRQFYRKRSSEKAFAQSRILKLYDNYRDTYLARPDLFLWAGLGRMAGGAVGGDLRLFITAGSETFFSKTMVQIGKDIFEDLAWQHEAILDEEANAVRLAAQHDATVRAQRSYHEAWVHILPGDAARVATGGRYTRDRGGRSRDPET
jgi:hypothetical protein